MPTRDDTYRDSYSFWRKKREGATNGVLRGDVVTEIYANYQCASAEAIAGHVDAAADILLERGLCASVLNWWHKKPAGDELPR